MLELASLVTGISATTPGTITFRSRLMTRPSVSPDIAQARAVLDWESTVQLREGLTNTVEYFRKVAAVRRASGRGWSGRQGL